MQLVPLSCEPRSRSTHISDAWSRTRQGLARLVHQLGVDDWSCFLHAWRRDPRAMGAMAPSSRALAQAITAGIAVDGRTVLELGVGTGAFTRALLAAGHRESDLVLVERDAALAHRLCSRFPQATVLEGDAGAAAHASVWRDAQAAPASIVCGVPLLNMTVRQQLRLMRGASAALPPGGSMFLFTYGLRFPLRPALRARLGLRVRRVAFVLPNLPPASVWQVTWRPAPGRHQPARGMPPANPVHRPAAGNLSIH